MRNNPKTVTSRCEVRIYHYKNQVLGDGENFDDSKLLDCEVIDINSADNCIMSFTYERALANASGMFSLTLAPNKNWLNVARPGDWITISLSQSGSFDKEVRCLGNIDRVAQTEVVQPDGARVVTYTISGRDYGKVFEKYNVYFNTYDPKGSAQRFFLGEKGVFKIVGQSDEIITQLVQVFLGGKFENTNGAQKQLDAFRIPKQLAQDFGGSDSVKFGDILQLKLDSIPGYRGIIGEYIQEGQLWQLMLMYGNNLMNELFVEHTKVVKGTTATILPCLTLRLFPFTDRDFTVPEPFTSAARKFQDLDTVIITGEDIFSSDIGVADHDRINFSLIYGDVSSARGADPTIALLVNGNPSFPYINAASIRRHGLSSYIHGSSFTGSGNNNISAEVLRGWNILNKHWFLENTNLESGTIRILGNADIRTGKRLYIKDAKMNSDKEFYIEGVTDDWSYPGQWNQTLQVTRGRNFNGTQSALVVEKYNSNSELSGRSYQSDGRK